MAFGVESLDFFTESQLFHADDVIGCMDKNNLNYDPAATINDGDRCGGCVQGFTRLGDPAFLCQEVDAKYVDCKTGETYWRFKGNTYKHQPAMTSYYCVETWRGGSCYFVKTRVLGNDGTPWLDNKNTPKAINQVKWGDKHKEIKNKCGSANTIPVSPEDVPNFLGLPTSTPAENVPGQAPAPNVAAQTTSTPLSTPMQIQTMSGYTEPVEPAPQEPQGTNWMLIGGVAIVAYLISGQMQG